MNIKVKAAHSGHGFGRIDWVDLRDHGHLAPAGTSTGAKEWGSPRVLDQGLTPMSVAYALVGLLEADPAAVNSPDPRALYKQAQLRDELPGVSYQGTTLRGGMKALRKLGFVSSYLWAFNVSAAATWILGKGPCVFGTIWANSMMAPDDGGWIGVSGDYVSEGGHCYLVRGVDTDRSCPDGSKGAFLIQNSWGPSWGASGCAWLSFKDAGVLLAEGGEVVMAAEKLKVEPSVAVAGEVGESDLLKAINRVQNKNLRRELVAAYNMEVKGAVHSSAVREGDPVSERREPSA